MDDYTGGVLGDRYRLPFPGPEGPEGFHEGEFAEFRAWDTYSEQEVLVRQVPLPETVDAEVVDGDGPNGYAPFGAPAGRPARGLVDPAVARAVDAARAAARVPDHPRLDQVFDVFAEGGSLWIVSEWVATRPLSALIAEKPLTPYRAAEVAADVLTALRAVHVHGWTHRNVTTNTVLVCEDGRVLLTGLVSGAAEEALCGYDPVPPPGGPDGDDGFGTPHDGYEDGYGDNDDRGGADDRGHDDDFPGGHDRGRDGAGHGAPGGTADSRAARLGAIAAYRAGARAAAERRGSDPDRPAGDRWSGDPVPAPRPGGTPHYTDHISTGTASGTGAPPYGGDATGPDPDPEHGTGGHEDPGGGTGGGYPGPALLTGTWNDPPVAGQDGLPPLPAGGGYLPAEPNPHRNSDPYGVRAVPPAGRAPDGPGLPALPTPGARPALPAPEPADPGPPGTRAVPAWDHGGAGHDALSADARRTPPPPPPPPPPPSAPVPVPASWDVPPAARRPRGGGPATPLAAERARQARIAVVGAVTERWAPEQAGPVHENWQLAAPVGPATDLWALGALLYRSVQGHAPYPEDSAAELVQLVCAEPPAFAEECGPLRPVVESLLRQDPTERLDIEELSGWLRSLVRSAPEPEAGDGVVPLPPPAAPGRGTRLPVIRRRGELVRRRRPVAAEPAQGRHRHKKQPSRRGPRSLGRTLLLGVFLLLAGAVAYAVVFLPKAEEDPRNRGARIGEPGPRPTASVSAPGSGTDTTTPPPAETTPGAGRPQTTAPAPGGLPDGFVLRSDPEGFAVAVDSSWQRRPINDAGQIRYGNGDFTLIVVPGRDAVTTPGEDPLTYQRDRERELQPFRESSWATSSGLRRIEIGRRVMAEGQYTWQDGSGREVYVRNRALVIGGRYHVLQVIGPSDRRDQVTRAYEQAVETYRPAGD
jgi:serine/threonine protein kinase